MEKATEVPYVIFIPNIAMSHKQGVSWVDLYIVSSMTVQARINARQKYVTRASADMSQDRTSGSFWFF